MVSFKKDTYNDIFMEIELSPEFLFCYGKRRFKGNNFYFSKFWDLKYPEKGFLKKLEDITDVTLILKINERFKKYVTNILERLKPYRRTFERLYNSFEGEYEEKIELLLKILVFRFTKYLPKDVIVLEDVEDLVERLLKSFIYSLAYARLEYLMENLQEKNKKVKVKIIFG